MVGYVSKSFSSPQRREDAKFANSKESQSHKVNYELRITNYGFSIGGRIKVTESQSHRVTE
jgi:hypothetical protein